MVSYLQMQQHHLSIYMTNFHMSNSSHELHAANIYGMYDSLFCWILPSYADALQVIALHPASTLTACQ